MRFKDVIYLISVIVQKDENGHPMTDENGNPIEILTERMVYANEYSVSSSEYYNAAMTGLRPAKQFEIYSFEYQGEDRLKHNGVTYRIIRAETRGEKTRLTCERVAADG